MIVEDDEAFAPAREECAQFGDEGAALARSPVPERQHFGERSKVPASDAKPVDASFEVSREAVSECTREHRFAAAARTDQCDSGRTRGDNGPNERGEFAGSTLHATRWGGRGQACAWRATLAGRKRS